MNEEYFKELAKQVPNVIKVLTSKGIKESYLQFGGAGPTPQRSANVPTDARSEFLANRAMGDWAEGVLTSAIQCGWDGCKVSQYGDTNTKAAGEEGFKEDYRSGLEATRLYGKRPDLLILPRDVIAPSDISALSEEKSAPIVAQALGALEVRSSKFDALRYMEVRKQEHAAGKKPPQLAPSFTVKVEDLKIVYRWIERHQIPQAYTQVFFDSVYALNVLDIFRTIASGSRFKIATPDKSQLKATIMISITDGRNIASSVTPPDFDARHSVTRLGRHDTYVVPVGGSVTLDIEELKKSLMV